MGFLTGLVSFYKVSNVYLFCFIVVVSIHNRKTLSNISSKIISLSLIGIGFREYIIFIIKQFELFNCSQMKFVAIILILLVFFYAIFRLTDFSSDAFDFSSSKTG